MKTFTPIAGKLKKNARGIFSGRLLGDYSVAHAHDGRKLFTWHFILLNVPFYPYNAFKSRKLLRKRRKLLIERSLFLSQRR
jgi:hypothetical protein